MAFLIKFRFWVENLGAKYYNNHINRNVIKNKKYITL